MPGRISTLATQAGVHMTCGKDLVDSTAPFYLKDSPRLQWLPVNKVTSDVTPVLVTGGTYQYHIGRVNLLSGGKYYQQIGKVHINNGATDMWYMVNGVERTAKTNYDVLVCNGPAPVATTPAPTPPPTPLPSKCSFTRDLFDASGSYISSICWRNAKVTSAAGVTSCRSLNMPVFTVSSVVERDALLAFTATRFRLGGGSSIWISGVNVTGWKDSNDRRTPLGSFSYPTNMARAGSCLNLGSFGGVQKFELTTLNCSVTQSVYCEWVNPNPVRPTTKAMTTTFAPPASSLCTFTKDLFGPSGSYISTICWRNVKTTSPNAVGSCNGLNMHVFTISSVDERDALLAFTAVHFASGLGKGLSIWISGVNANGWKDSNDGTTALGSFAFPTKTNRTGDCLNLGSFDGVQGFELMTFNCSVMQSVYCEFVNKNPVRPTTTTVGAI
jgi:hypothetical protein